MKKLPEFPDILSVRPLMISLILASFALVACDRASEQHETPAVADEMPAAKEDPTAAAVANALEAAWPGMATDAAVVDWEGNVLKEGSNGYTCLPTPAQLTDNAPMCMDAGWMEWAQAWNTKGPYEAKGLHISYMLGGDGGASNTDPYAEGPTEDNEWIKEAAHLMIIAPAELLDAYPTDPNNGGPYVMWKGTPYAHLMVPIGARD